MQNDPGNTPMDDGQLKPRKLREYTEEDIKRIMGEVTVYIKALIPIDAQYIFIMVNPYNWTSAYIGEIGGIDGSVADELRKIANTICKENK